MITVLLLIFLSCSNQSPQQRLFDTVWNTVNETYPDTTFNSNTWKAIGDRYQSRIINSIDSIEQIDLLNQMLFELNVSHAFLGSISQIKQKASPYMFKPGSPGFDIHNPDLKLDMNMMSWGLFVVNGARKFVLNAGRGQI